MSLCWTSVETRLGRFLVASQDGEIVSIKLPGTEPAILWQELADLAPGTEAEARLDAVLVRATEQIQEFVEGLRTEFQLPIRLQGTAFQEAVWQQLQNIPYGETRSYAQLAEAVGKPGAARAVGGANRANPLPLVVPCHRVVAADGSLGGYAGEMAGAGGLKARLLDLERV